jgi:CheY-like chemotaxis protein
MVDLLLETALDPEQRRFAGTIQASGELLLSIINDVLDLSKIEAGKLELEARAFDPRISLARVDEMLRPSADEQRLVLTVAATDRVPPAIVGDDMRLRQIMLNLASNAIKFTHVGRVAVALDARQVEGQNERLEMMLSVTDTGIGIAAQRLDAVFEPFAQAEASTTREYGGSGLGLAICRRIAAMMQGRLDVESVPERGSVFTLTWLAEPARMPAPAAVAGTPVVQPPATRGSSPRALKVLLAEDNAVNQTLACALLGRLGVVPDVVGDGERAVAQARSGDYDLVLMDLQMPRLDGLSATRQIRKLAIARQPRVAAITANAFDEDRRACLDAGMDDFVAKPFRMQDLERVIERTRASLHAAV